MDARPFGLAVPNYAALGLPGPYMGDRVWEELQKMNGEDFAYIPITVVAFPDGSEKVIIDQNVRNKEVYVIHPQYTRPSQHVMIGAQMCDALYRSDSQSVYLFEPYNSYFRQDARQDREAPTERLVADFYHQAGMNGEFTLDIHSKQASLAFRKLEPLPMTGKLASHIAHNPDRYDLSKAVVVAPDSGGFQRAEKFANLLNLPLAYAHKERIDGKTVILKAIIGEIEGRDLYIFDDILASGGTVVEIGEYARAHGALDVYGVATHLGLYNNGAQRLRQNNIRVVGTNTIPNRLTEDDMKSGYFDIVDIAPLLAEVIHHKSQGGSIRAYFADRVENVNGGAPPMEIPAMTKVDVGS